MLLAVAERGSFAAAAAELSFTPSAVSQQMAMLEREAGIELFERSSRGIRLTPSGQALVRHAETIHLTLLDARAELDGLAQASAGRVAFGSFPTATAVFAAGAVGSFHSQHGEVEVSVTDGEPYESVARLRARTLDLALVFELDSWPANKDYDGHLVASTDDVVVEDLFDDPFDLLLPTDHPLAGDQREIELKELAEERIIGSPVGAAPWGMDLEHVCKLAGVEPMFAAVYRSPDLQSQQAFVAAGLGISLLPRLAQRTLRSDVAIRPLMHAPVRHIRLAWPAGAYRSGAATALGEFVSAAAADLRLSG
jgi:DNA-binding transcriptional LysR family regulator